MKYCPYCGSGLQDDMLFCPNCGQKFQSGITREIEGAAQSTQISQNNSSDGFAPVIKDKSFVETHREKAKRAPIVALVILIIIAAVATVAVFFIAQQPQNEADQLQAVIEEGIVPEDTPVQTSQDVDIADEASSVLYLEIYDDSGTVTSTASGFLINDGTQLVTNYHVISTAYFVKAFSSDGEQLADFHNCLFYDSCADLAVLQCETPISEVMSLPIGNSDYAKQGDAVYAVGYPLGVANTLSNGVISSRYMDEYDVDTLQITAAISPGSSGGALLNDQGEVIGIVCASYTLGQNLNLAIASNVLIELLQKTGEITPLSTLYYENTKYGNSSFNLVDGSGCFICETSEAYYYSDQRTIYCIHKDGGQPQKIGSGTDLNIYKGKLYYVSNNVVYQADLDGSHAVDLGISSSEPSAKYTWGYKNGIYSMFLAEDKIFLVIDEDHTQKFSLYVFDLSTLTLIEYIQDTSLYLTYRDKTLYTGLETGEILALDMETLDRNLFQTPCVPCICGIDASGNIYFVDEYNAFSEGVFQLSPDGNITADKATIGEYAGEGFGYSFKACGLDLFFEKSGANFSEIKKGTWNGAWTQWGEETFDIFSLNYVESLNYFYLDNGDTYRASDGKYLGSWVFE